MEPLLKKRLRTPLKLNLWFLPIVLVGTLVAFVTLGLTTNSILAALYISPVIGVGAGWLLVGWPRLITGKEGKPLVGKRAKPFLFFPIFPLISVVLYPVLGLMLTPFVDPAYMAYLSIALALVLGVGLAYLLVGFPPLVSDTKRAWGRIPPATKPWLSLPGGALIAIFLYYAIGIGLTRTPLPVDYATWGAIILSLVLGYALAILIFGFPKPKRNVSEMVPRVAAPMRPLAFAIVLVVLTPLFSFALGPFIGAIPGLPPKSDLYLTLLAAFILSFGVAALVIGLPHRWRRLADYKGGVPDHVRLALFLPLWAALTLGLTVTANVAGLGIAVSALVAALVTVGPALVATGAWRRISNPDSIRRAWETPDTLKPVFMILLWVFLSLVFFGLTRVVYATFRYNLFVGAALGLIATVLIVEAPLIGEWRAERRNGRDEEKRLRALRKERLAAAKPQKAPRTKTDGQATSAGAAASKPGFLGRFRRK